MKRIIKNLTILVFGASIIVLSGCYKDVKREKDGEDVGGEKECNCTMSVMGSVISTYTEITEGKCSDLNSNEGGLKTECTQKK